MSSLAFDRQSKTLTSWKEIAQYLGKGVRTVQRWETSMGLPIRRPAGRTKGTVIAFSEDIDRWLQSRFTAAVDAKDAEITELRRIITQLIEENDRLRRKLKLDATARRLASEVISKSA